MYICIHIVHSSVCTYDHKTGIIIIAAMCHRVELLYA